MIEIYIECWASPDGIKYPWSIWQDGRQLESSHASALHDDQEQSETEARRYCSEVLKVEPSKVIRL